MSGPVKNLTTRRVLVTGGAGFIGSHLCERLLARGDEVLCVDNFYTGGRHNVHHLLSHPRFELMRHDVCFPLYVEVDRFQSCLPGFADLLSARSGSDHEDQRARRDQHAWSCQAREGCDLQASTSEVYGDPDVQPQVEEYWGNVNPIGPRSCYDEGKRCAETLFFDYYRQHRLRIKVARIFNTYGPRMHPSDGRVVSEFIVQALRNDDITIYGDGSRTRAFCYVEDLVDGLLRLMETPDSVTGPLNLGNPENSRFASLRRALALWFVVAHCASSASR